MGESEGEVGRPLGVGAEGRVALAVLGQVDVQARIRALGDRALLFDEREDTLRTLDGATARTVVQPLEVELREREAFSDALRLRSHNHDVREETLESFVGVVDAQLLERVALEDFKAENVEDAHAQWRGRLGVLAERGRGCGLGRQRIVGCERRG